MDTYKIVLSDEFFQDFCFNKDKKYSKTDIQVSIEADKNCRGKEYKLATCLSGYYDAIKTTCNVPDDKNVEDSTSKEFKGVLQCSNLFKEYEACIRKA